MKSPLESDKYMMGLRGRGRNIWYFGGTGLLVAAFLLSARQIEANPGMSAVAGLLSTLNAPDPYANSVILLMNADGVNAATTFVDGSSLNNTITANGTAQISTTQSRFGGSSAKFDGSSAYLQIPGSNFVLGSSNFTIEAWVYLKSNPAQESTLAGSETFNSDGFNSVDAGWQFGLNRGTAPSGGVHFSICNSGTCSYSQSFGSFLSLNTWHHVAVARSGGTIYQFADGVLLGSAAVSMSQTDNKPYIRIGDFFANGSFYGPGALNGYIDDLRITMGIARYTANYTVPRQPFLPASDPFFSNLYIGLHLDGTNGSTTFTDVMGHTITGSGSAQISTAQSKFGGASLLLNSGTADYISAPAHTIGTSDFTLEAWIYQTSRNATNGNDIFDYRPAGTNGAYPTLGIDQNGKAGYYVNSVSVIAGTTTVSLNSWHHLAVSRSSGTLRLFLDGKQEGSSYADGVNYVSAVPKMGYNAFLSSIDFTGYLDEVRITLAGRYTANFTPSQMAFPSAGAPLTFTSSGAITFPSTVSCNTLVVAGGGGGGGHQGNDKGGGGGGGGGLIYSPAMSVPAGTYSVTVGAGGSAGTAGGGTGGSGANSVFYTLTAIGGGGGGPGTGGGPYNGSSGGSGGGAVSAGSTGGTGGSATAGQGYAGGNGGAPNDSAGGGGAGGVGGNSSASLGGNGGPGLTYNISGSSVTYAGGGGGGAYSGTGGSGGTGGGGNAGAAGAVGSNGAPNTGGGGGGAGSQSSSNFAGGTGGSGIVILQCGPNYAGPGDVIPGAAVWYGLRGYSKAYATGANNAINIRRASDNATTNIVILANGNLDTATASTFCASTTCYVTKAYDQSGHGIDASQATAAKQPQLLLSGCGLGSASQPCMSFSGSTYLAATISSAAQPFTWSSVAYRSTVNGYSVVIGVSGSPNSDTDFSNSANLLRMWAGGGFTTTATDANWYAIQAVANGASSVLSVNGSATAGNAGTNASGTALGVGCDGAGNNCLIGNITETGQWTSGFSSPQQTSMCHNQYVYWGTSPSC